MEIDTTPFAAELTHQRFFVPDRGWCITEQDALGLLSESITRRNEELELEIERYRQELHTALAAKQKALEDFREADNDRRQLSDELTAVQKSNFE